MQCEHHPNIRELRVARKRVDGELGGRHRREKHEVHIEQKGIQEGLVLFHGVEADDEGDAQAEFYVAFLDRPEQVDGEQAEDSGGDEV